MSYEVGTYTFPLEYDANGNLVKEFGAMYYLVIPEIIVPPISDQAVPVISGAIVPR